MVRYNAFPIIIMLLCVAFFIRPFYKMVLGRPITLQDMQSVDIELHNSVQYVLENDPEPLCLSFSVNKTVLGEVCPINNNHDAYCCAGPRGRAEARWS